MQRRVMSDYFSNKYIISVTFRISLPAHLHILAFRYKSSHPSSFLSPGQIQAGIPLLHRTGPEVLKNLIWFWLLKESNPNCPSR